MWPRPSRERGTGGSRGTGQARTSGRAAGGAGPGGRPGVRGRGVRRRRRDVRRGGVLHRHDRLPGDADRPVVLRPGRGDDRAAHRQHRGERPRLRVVGNPGRRLRRTRPEPAVVELAGGARPGRRARPGGHRGHQRRGHPRAHPPPARAWRDALRHLQPVRRPGRAAGQGAGEPRDGRCRPRPRGEHPRAVRRRPGRRGAPLSGRGPGPGDQAQHTVVDGRPRLRGTRPAGEGDRRRPAGRRAGRGVLLQRPRRPRDRRLRGRGGERRAARRRAAVRDLLRKPGARPGARLRHLQARLRPPWHQPAGQGSRDRPDRGDLPQPRLRGRRAHRRDARRHPVRPGRRQPRSPQRRCRRGHRLPGRAGVQRPVPPGGGGGPTRRPGPVRPVLRAHGGHDPRPEGGK